MTHTDFGNPHDVALSRIFWIGGSPCSGKSSISDRLAERYGLHLYRCDDALAQHIERFVPEEKPVFARLTQASCDELWMRPVAQQIAEELAFYGEEHSLILDDLRSLLADRPVIAEGAALLPRLLDKLGVGRRRAIWIVPSEAFQREQYAMRDWRHDILRDCRDTEQAWQNWMARDAGFVLAVAHDARTRGYHVLTVDGSQSLDETTEIVERHFGLSIA